MAPGPPRCRERHRKAADQLRRLRPANREGRQAVADLYRPYGDTIVLDRCDDLAVHHDPKTGVVVLEYACQGRVVATGAPYANQYISVLTIADRKVSRWRDYLDPSAACVEGDVGCRRDEFGHRRTFDEVANRKRRQRNFVRNRKETAQ